MFHRTPLDAFAGELRAARSELIPQIPMLAPQLVGDRLVIGQALCDILMRRGVDPASVHRQGLNKAERHSIAGFLIGELRHEFVDGEGEEATLLHEKAYAERYGHSLLTFVFDSQTAQAKAAALVEARFTQATTPKQQWWPLAQNRYKKLGYEALLSSGVMRFVRHTIAPTLTLEGMSLRSALRSPAINSTFPWFVTFINSKMLTRTPEERLAAAHDLSYLVTSRASTHFLNFVGSKPELHGEIVQDETTGKYRVIYPNSTQRPLYRRRKTLPSPAMKCPAHADAGPDKDTNLETMVHATINSAHEYGVFEHLEKLRIAQILKESVRHLRYAPPH